MTSKHDWSGATTSLKWRRPRQRRLVQENHRRRRGEILQIKGKRSTPGERCDRSAQKLYAVAREVGTEGRRAERATTSRASGGTWKDLNDSVIRHGRVNLTGQVRNIAEVTSAWAEAISSRKLP